ncbi:uncharacterized protein LOC128279174 [Anopheles cruzii]|uniref:uncharacterized protein LOC128279174 n=1 Tax=Anopheles cruzii TaxID=68878 RepID=UPI0022EC21F2|nr:uncharacterized protein LOC128279174 [Anopheles cruzii]
MADKTQNSVLLASDPSAGDGPQSVAAKTKFNPSAKPFYLSSKKVGPNQQSQGDAGDAGDDGIAYIGPTRLPVSTRVWNAISSYSLEEIGTRCPPPPPPVPVRPCPRITTTTYSRLPTQANLQQLILRACTYQPQPVQQSPFLPAILPNGVIQLRLRDSVDVDLTLEGSIRVYSGRKDIAIAVSSNGAAVAMRHPNGIIFQHGPRVDIMAYDAKRNNSYIRFAKMWNKGISLTSDGSALIYLVDSAGTRTTCDMLNMDLETDYVNQVFYNGIVCGPQVLPSLHPVVQGASFTLGDEGQITYELNGFRIIQSGDGLVKVYRPSHRCVIRTSPTNGCATVTTNLVHCTASLGATSHLFVRREERRMHFDGATFIVRNAGHSAGFDEFNRLRVY